MRKLRNLALLIESKREEAFKILVAEGLSKVLRREG